MLQCCTRHRNLNIPGRPGNHHHPDKSKHYYIWKKPQPVSYSNQLTTDACTTV